MKAKFRKYKPEQDFMRVRDLLVSSQGMLDRPINWGIERWNYARYLVVPYLGPGKVVLRKPEDSLRSIHAWENMLGIWENDEHEIVGAVTLEYSWPGDAFFQRHPRYDFILGDMLDYAEENLRDPKTNSLKLHIYEHDEAHQALARQRGYQKDVEDDECDAEFIIGGLPEPRLPEGYVLRSMADDNNIELRRKIYGLGFNHRDPAEWASAFAYQELQKAPDYRKDLDLVVVGPDGEYVSCCIVWYDERNRKGSLEHVSTHLDFRRKGFGRQVVLEGIRRAAALGAERVWVGSSQQFYLALGFQVKYISYGWVKQF